MFAFFRKVAGEIASAHPLEVAQAIKAEQEILPSLRPGICCWCKSYLVVE